MIAKYRFATSLTAFLLHLLFGATLPPRAVYCQTQPESKPDSNTELAEPTKQLWYGVLDAEVREFRFLVELTHQDERWQGSLLSLDEGNQRFDLDDVHLSSNELHFAINQTSARYSGQRSASGNEIDGQWMQRGAELKLSFKRVEEIPEQQLDAVWEGELNAVIQKLKVAFRIFDSGKVLFDSVSQKAGGFVAEMTTEGDEVRIELPALKATFTGNYNSDRTEIIGTWKQGLIPLPLTLSRTETPSPAPPPVVRPQTPQAPFPYRVQKVNFQNEVDEITLAGTLTTPKTSKPSPAVILISGSGPQDRDETLVGHKPFWVIADHLSRNGIAVLRFDDRGVGESEGDFASATSEEFANDVAAAANFLKTQPSIAGAQIGLLGHSEGGIVAPMVAARDPSIAFLVLLAAPGVNGAEILVSQSRLLLEASKTNPAEIAQQGKLQRILVELGSQQPPLAETEFQQQAMRRIGNEIPELQLSDEQLQAVTAAAAKQMSSPWMRFFLTYEPTQALSQIRCPVLAINGQKDLQVDSNLNLPQIQSSLQQAPCEDYTVKALAGLNHLFQQCETGLVTEYGSIEQTIAPEVLELISNWIRQRFP